MRVLIADDEDLAIPEEGRLMEAGAVSGQHRHRHRRLETLFCQFGIF